MDMNRPRRFNCEADGGRFDYSQSFFLKKKKIPIPINAISPSTA